MKVRFHLGGGEHHRKFQVIDDAGVKTYYDPELCRYRPRAGSVENAKL